MFHPVALHLCAIFEIGAGACVFLERLACVLAGDLAFGEVRLVAAVVHGDVLLCQIEFHDSGDGAREELAIVAHDNQCCARLGDKSLQLLETA